MKIFDNKKVLITGGTGSLGKKLVQRLLSGKNGTPEKIVVFSRDEAKQQAMRLDYYHKKNFTDEIIFHNFEQKLEFRIGDVRDYNALAGALRGMNIVINAAALKQVPTCEYFPYEAANTNITGAANLVQAIRNLQLDISTVVGISTDKACKPVNAMGITKALQERILIAANIDVPQTRFVCVRYGNVLASRGSVIPMFLDQISGGGPVTLTSDKMTRFLLSLEKAVDTVVFAIQHAARGTTVIPKIPAVNMLNVAKAMIGNRDIKLKITGVRPGEKMDEIMISEEETGRTENSRDYYIIHPMLPELQNKFKNAGLKKEYSSADDLLDLKQTRQLLKENQLLPGMLQNDIEEILR